jgi:hypothetical protein
MKKISYNEIKGGSAMFSINEILEKYILRVSKVREDTYIINPDIYLDGYNESLAIVIQNISDECIRISDCHVVWNYLEINGIDPLRYKEKIDKILKRTGVCLDENTFYIEQEYTSIDQIHSMINSLLQAIFLIANIDL